MRTCTTINRDHDITPTKPVASRKRIALYETNQCIIVIICASTVELNLAKENQAEGYCICATMLLGANTAVTGPLPFRHQCGYLRT